MSKRKSLLAVRPNVSEPPPRVHGRPWWTTPPLSAPEPRHLTYAREYRAELVRNLSGAGTKQFQVGALISQVNDWIRQANRLSGERAHERLGLARSSDLWVEASRLIGRMIRNLDPAYELTERDRHVANAVSERSKTVLYRKLERK